LLPQLLHRFLQLIQLLTQRLQYHTDIVY
jgi:hypothetical protein